MNRTEKRNIIGSIVCFFLSFLLGAIGLAVMMLREVKQSQDYHFEIEKDDIVRYSFVGIFGYICQVVTVLILLL